MITPSAGYIVDPRNPNGVIRDPGVAPDPFASPVTQSPQAATRNLQFQQGNPAVVAQQGQQQTQAVGGNVPPPPQNFNSQIMGMLQQYQKLGTAGFAKQGLDASDAQAGRISAQTSPDLIGAAPSVQNSVRSASASALSPTIAGANQSAQTFGEQINSFGDAVKNVQQIMRDKEAQDQQVKDNAKNALVLAMQLGGAAGLESLAKENPDVFKIAGLDKDTLIHAATAQQTKDEASKKTFQTVDLGDRVGVFDNQGNLVKTVAKGQNPGTVGSNTTKPTDANNVSSGYAARATSAGDVISNLQSTIQKMSPLSFSLQTTAEPNALGSSIVSNDIRQVRQAERNFVTAVLRKESGASISPDEFATAEKVYFPRPGDDATTLQQKATARQLATNSLIQSAGPAYTAPAGSGAISGVTTSGLKYTVTN